MERYKKTYRNFTIAFWFHLACFLFVIVMNKHMDDAMAGLWLLAFAGSGLAYLIFLGTLAAGANKSVIQWVGGTMLFSYIGLFVSFYKMKTVAIEQGWDK